MTGLIWLGLYISCVTAREQQTVHHHSLWTWAVLKNYRNGNIGPNIINHHHHKHEWRKHKQHRLSAVPPSPWCDVLNVSEEWKCVCYQDVSSIVSRLSGQTDSQPLVIAVCFTRLPTAQHICTHIHTQINSTAYTVSHRQPSQLI